VSRAQEILARIVAGSREIADRFISRRGWGDLGEQARPQELGELARIPPIRFDVITGFARALLPGSSRAPS